jgi:hypothetical protein
MVRAVMRRAWRKKTIATEPYPHPALRAAFSRRREKGW